MGNIRMFASMFAASASSRPNKFPRRRRVICRQRPPDRRRHSFPLPRRSPDLSVRYTLSKTKNALYFRFST